MAGVSVFTDLVIWKRAREWSKQIFWKTKLEPFCFDHKLVVQINDSSESVMSNIAEGFGRGTQGEFVQFLGYSIGSLNETQSHLCAAFDRQYLAKDEFGQWFQEGTEIRMQIIAFIRSMIMPGSGVKNIRKVKSFSEEVWEIYKRFTGQQRPEFWQKKEEKQPG